MKAFSKNFYSKDHKMFKHQSGQATLQALMAVAIASAIGVVVPQIVKVFNNQQRKLYLQSVLNHHAGKLRKMMANPIYYNCSTSGGLVTGNPCALRPNPANAAESLLEANAQQVFGNGGVVNVIGTNCNGIPCTLSLNPNAGGSLLTDNGNNWTFQIRYNGNDVKIRPRDVNYPKPIITLANSSCNGVTMTDPNNATNVVDYPIFVGLTKDGQRICGRFYNDLEGSEANRLIGPMCDTQKGEIMVGVKKKLNATAVVVGAATTEKTLGSISSQIPKTGGVPDVGSTYATFEVRCVRPDTNFWGCDDAGNFVRNPVTTNVADSGAGSESYINQITGWQIDNTTNPPSYVPSGTCAPRRDISSELKNTKVQWVATGNQSSCVADGNATLGDDISNAWNPKTQSGSNVFCGSCSTYRIYECQDVSVSPSVVVPDSDCYAAGIDPPVTKVASGVGPSDASIGPAQPSCTSTSFVDSSCDCNTGQKVRTHTDINPTAALQSNFRRTGVSTPVPRIESLGCSPLIAKTNFGYTGGYQSYTVPSGTQTIRVAAWGASGAGDGSATGGVGGFTIAKIPVTPGAGYSVVVGRYGEPIGWASGGAAFGFGGWASTGTWFPANSGGGGLTGLFESGNVSKAGAILIAGGGGSGADWYNSMPWAWGVPGNSSGGMGGMQGAAAGPGDPSWAGGGGYSGGVQRNGGSGFVTPASCASSIEMSPLYSNWPPGTWHVDYNGSAGAASGGWINVGFLSISAYSCTCAGTPYPQ